MKRQYFILVMAVLVLAVTNQSCKSKNNKEKQQTEEITIQAALSIDNLLQSADTLAGKEIEAEGICTHICKHGGGKIFLMGSDDTQTIRIEAGKEFGKFKQETVNNIVRVKGTLVEDRIDEAYLTQWEEKVKAQTAEQHGEGEAGCSTEQKARGEATTANVNERIANFRKRIAERNEKEGKNYLSFYHINATEYAIQ